MSFFYGDDDLLRTGRRPLLIFVLATLAVGAAASLFSKPAISRWYAGLVHPALTPPDWIFAPVWTRPRSIGGTTKGRKIIRGSV